MTGQKSSLRPKGHGLRRALCLGQEWGTAEGTTAPARWQISENAQKVGLPNGSRRAFWCYDLSVRASGSGAARIQV